MVRIKTPASSANLGPGFDTMGIALSVYNTYDVRLSDRNILHGCDERYANEDNLFLQAYRFGMDAIGFQDHVEVSFDCRIPVSRGMGSSAAFIVAGITAASALHDNALSKEEIFQLACRMEGHPDNISPCFHGGLTVSMLAGSGMYITRKIIPDDGWYFTVLVPDFEVSTKQARNALPASYSRQTAVNNCSRALLLSEALRSGDEALLKEACTDEFHEPYRRKLIADYDLVRGTVLADTDGVFVISGSGPSCLLISRRELSTEAENRIRNTASHSWQAIRTVADDCGTMIESESL